MVDESCSNMEKIKETVKEILQLILQQKGTPEDSGKICYPG